MASSPILGFHSLSSSNDSKDRCYADLAPGSVLSIHPCGHPVLQALLFLLGCLDEKGGTGD